MTLLLPRQPIYLQGPSYFLPERVLSNDDLVEWMGASFHGSMIAQRTGVMSRHWVTDSQACSDLAIAAAKRLFATYPVNLSNIDELILATISGDFPTPPTSPLLLPDLGLNNIGVLDIGAACAGFTSGIYTAACHSLATAKDKLLISAEVRSKFLAKKDLATTALFGDGSASCLISTQAENAQFELVGAELGADPSVADIISIPKGGSRSPHHVGDDSTPFLHMKKGATLFIKGVDLMSKAATHFLDNFKMTTNDIDWFVPHQANRLLMDAIVERVGINPEKLVSTVEHTGNTSGASVGIALGHLLESKKLEQGQTVLLASAGAGGSSACALLKYVGDNRHDS